MQCSQKDIKLNCYSRILHWKGHPCTRRARTVVMFQHQFMIYSYDNDGMGAAEDTVDKTAEAARWRVINYLGFEWLQELKRDLQVCNYFTKY